MIPHKANELYNCSLSKYDIGICNNKTIIIIIVLYVSNSNIVAISITAIESRTDDLDFFGPNLIQRN